MFSAQTRQSSSLLLLSSSSSSSSSSSLLLLSSSSSSSSSSLLLLSSSSSSSSSLLLLLSSSPSSSLLLSSSSSAAAAASHSCTIVCVRSCVFVNTLHACICVYEQQSNFYYVVFDSTLPLKLNQRNLCWGLAGSWHDAIATCVVQTHLYQVAY